MQKKPNSQMKNQISSSEQDQNLDLYFEATKALEQSFGLLFHYFEKKENIDKVLDELYESYLLNLDDLPEEPSVYESNMFIKNLKNLLHKAHECFNIQNKLNVATS